jgi:hypothetical protein
VTPALSAGVGWTKNSDSASDLMEARRGRFIMAVSDNFAATGPQGSGRSGGIKS